jgi:hypothetical protein
MVQIVVILLVAYILVPLIDMTLKEQALFFTKLLVYVIAFVWVVYTLFFVH